MKPVFRSGICAGVLLIVASAQIALAQRETKAQRVEQLNTALTHLDRAVELLSTEPADQGAKEHKQELENLKKARDAVQRLVNNVEGRDENTGLTKDHERDTREAKQRPSGDYYPGLIQIRQDLDDAYLVLSRDPAKNNDHRKNAMKFIKDAREPLVRDADEYAKAHPEIARPAQPAAVPQPGAPSAPPVNNSAAELQALNDVLIHQDHSVDILTNQPANSPQRQQLLSAVTRARDAVQGMMDEAQRGNQQKDVAAEHRRDVTAHAQKAYGYYDGLQTIQEYLHNDSIVISRQPEDASHLRTTTLQSMQQAQSQVQQAIDQYVKSHPNEKH